MNTQTIPITNTRAKEFDEIIETLNNDGIIIFPTETVWGIGASLQSEGAINNIFKLKGRDNNKPMQIMVNSVEMLEDYCKDIPPIFYKFASEFLPGPITCVLKKKDVVPNIVTAGLNTVGLRIPDNEIAIEIINRLKSPLVTSSANLSNNKATVSYDEVLDIFSGKVNIMIKSSDCKYKKESTVVDFTKEKIVILREGVMKEAEIMGTIY